MKRTIHYYIETYFPERVTYKDSVFSSLRVFLCMKKYSSRTIGAVINDIVKEAEKKDLEINIIHDCLDNKEIGIVLPQISAGLLFERSYIESEEYFTAQKLLSSARKIHDELEKIYIENTDFEKLNELNKDISNEIFGNEMTENVPRANNEIVAVDRFFGAMTAEGSNNYIENLTENINKRYFIKGRAGTGKSTFMKKLAEAAIKNGMFVEKYHCSFDPKSIDMIIVPKANVCVFDSTMPHELFPSRENDCIIDIYSRCVVPFTDEKYEEEIMYFQGAYNTLVKEGRECIRKYLWEAEKCNQKELQEEKENCFEITNAFLRLIRSV